MDRNVVYGTTTRLGRRSPRIHFVRRLSLTMSAMAATQYGQNPVLQAHSTWRHHSISPRSAKAMRKILEEKIRGLYQQPGGKVK